jgi:uncharacterized protein YndB with AHSA1/START domain
MGVIHGVVTFEESEGRTRMTTISTFESAEQMKKMADMGMEEGMREAMGQLDALLVQDVRA